MPLVKVEILKGKTREYKQALLDGIHAALVDSLAIPDSDRNQRLYELERENFEVSAGKTENVTLIELLLFPGRSVEAKKRLFQEIVRRLGENPGIAGNDILIVISEPPGENWGIRGGKNLSEVNLGYRLDV